MDGHWSRRGALKALGAAGGIVAAGGLGAPAWAGAPGAPAGPGVPGDPWARAAVLRRRIRPPRFPARRFDVTRFGADASGAAPSTAAFDRAIRACHDAGGGHVDVPAGTFLTGPIHLRSGVDLHLADGATVRFSQNPDDYLPVVYTRWQGIELMNHSPFVYAFGQRDIAITGTGTLDGQADGTHWWSWSGPDHDDWAALQQMAADGVPVARRVFGAGHHLRPSFIQPYRCENVLIEGVTLRNSPMWQIHPVLCRNVTVRGVTVPTHGPNTDGCDPECCRDVLITGCTFDDGDDCVAVKSGREADGRRVGVPSENIHIERCDFRNTYGAITVGSEMSGGVRDVYARDCTLGGSALHYGLYVKANSTMGGFAEDVHLRDLRITQLNHEVVSINLNHGATGAGPYPPRVERIEVRGVESLSSRNVYSIVGYPEDHIRDVRLIDCTFANVQQPSTAQYVDGLLLRDVTVNGAPATTG